MGLTTWSDLRAADLDAVLGWAEAQPWAEAMARCVQDGGWHAEGDVWTHTKMVCRELTRLDGWDTFSVADRAILTFTALLHDAAKPLTSRFDPETGRVTSPKHAIRGEHLARVVLRDLGCDLPTREAIARMVRFHGRPAFLLEKSDPAHEVIALSSLVDLRQLHRFALADTRGRRTAEMGRPEENLDLWRLVAEENGCYGRSFPFPSDHARFLFHRAERPDPHYAPFLPPDVATVTMLAGLPGAGKDTWLRTHRPDLPAVALDAIRDREGIDPTADQGAVIQHARDQCRDHLRAGRSFAFNATNLLRATRGRWIDLFAAYGARVEIVYVEPPMTVILDRNRRRGPQRCVPDRVIQSLAARLEPPTVVEAHVLTMVST